VSHFLLACLLCPFLPATSFEVSTFVLFVAARFAYVPILLAWVSRSSRSKAVIATITLVLGRVPDDVDENSPRSPLILILIHLFLSPVYETPANLSLLSYSHQTSPHTLRFYPQSDPASSNHPLLHPQHPFLPLPPPRLRHHPPVFPLPACHLSILVLPSCKPN
jgi:hypothetical protein